MPQTEKLLSKGLGEDVPVEYFREKQEPKLSDQNPLIYPPDLRKEQVVESMRVTLLKLIDSETGYDGLLPTKMNVALVEEDDKDPNSYRMTIRFETDNLDETQLSLLERIVEHMYGSGASTRLDSNGKPRYPTGYPRIETAGQKDKSRRRKDSSSSTLGWYMGLSKSTLEPTHQGLYVFRDLGSAQMADFCRGSDPTKWFCNLDMKHPFKKEKVQNKYIIEIREQGLYQTDIVKMATLVSLVLHKKDIPRPGKLLYEIYQEMIHLGQNEEETGMAELSAQRDEIRRSLFIPLANYNASDSVGFQPSSVLAIGIPGTGKTLLAKEFLLTRDLGVFMVPVDGMELYSDFSQPTSRQMILPRIAQVFEETGMPVVLHLDDVELFVDPANPTQSKLLNLMAGIRSHGFFVFASTNYPDRIDPRLFQHERFGSVVYFPRQDEVGRKRILEVHAQKVSKVLKHPLFSSDEERDKLLSFIARETEGFPARYLAQICSRAKTYYLERLSGHTKKRYGMTEQDVQIPFTRDDWMRAIADVQREFAPKRKEFNAWDDSLLQFVERHSGNLGFLQREQTPHEPQSYYSRYEQFINELKPGK